MTNADKYKISVEESDRMSDEFEKWHQDNQDVRGYGEALYRFLQGKVKPILSEEEKVILKVARNGMLEIIKRDKNNNVIWIQDDEGNKYTIPRIWIFISIY